ncbi:aromatic amino acid transport family protein [Parendozoicomonas haliclonae]|uniref:Serine transporter n=1 Tax=Parendozoicomonas haliclonae TaxID=1960125 RepID=A0A1X7AG88_9GAMM|nr:aromatic amino acid transport family protein [Parendozoicomonas haliclonae]SMA38097.1 Serine transporter [Parendozoicomonas haliclonae]
MAQGTTHTAASVDAKAKSWTKRDTEWMLTLFGTAIGAGVLFLPINAGLGGIWPLILMTILIGPMTFLAHRGLTRFCLSSKKADSDITETVAEHFGPKAGSLITLGYFASIYPILMIYGIGITNTISSLMVNQLGMETPNRALLSFVLVAGLVGVMTCGQKVVLKVTNALVYPLLVVLFGTSLYLIPQWNTAQFEASVSVADFVKTVFLTIPVLVFAFNHSPAVSSFATAYRKDEGDNAEAATNKTLKRTAFMLVGFTMLFVYSCVLTLSPAQLLEAKAANLSIMSYFAQNTDSAIFGWLAQIVAIVAIGSSFFGHYMGTREGLQGMIVNKAKREGRPVNMKLVDRGIIVFITLTVWAVAYANVSVMGMIESLVAPILAMILFIMPVYAVKKIPSMKKYESAWNIFTVIMGVVAITGFIASQLL